MNHKALASFAVFTLLFGVVSGVASADDKTDAKKDTRQQVQSKPSANNSDQKSCTNDLELIKKSLDDASKKITALKEKLYSEWQSQYSSGQSKDDWSVYAKKLESSQEMQDFRQIQEKYNLILSTCPAASTPTTYESKVQFIQSDECISAQKMIDDIDQKYSTLKQNAYNDWKSKNAAGTYPGTWDQYANEFINSSQVAELNQARQKYEPTLRTCYVQTNVPVSSTTSQRQSCPDADIQSVQSMLNDASQKIGTLKERVYSEWKASYNSGQTKDEWDTYSKKKFEGSQEFVNYQQLQQKLDYLYKMCKSSNDKPQTTADTKPVNPEPRVQFIQSDECISAKSMLDSIDQKYSILKQNAYNDWKSKNAAGTYPGTWDQYANEFIKSTEVLDLAKIREKYEPFLRTCYVQSNGMATSDASPTKPLPPIPAKTEQKPSIVTNASQTKPLSTTSSKTEKSPVIAASKTKPLSTVPAKTEQKQPAKTDDSSKKQDTSYAKLTKAKTAKDKKPKKLLVQK